MPRRLAVYRLLDHQTLPWGDSALRRIAITWDDFSDRRAVVPLLTRIYPTGMPTVNRFHTAGGMAFPDSRALLDGGFLLQRGRQP